NRAQLWLIVMAWRTRKREELQFVAVASTVLTAVLTASFSWPNVPDAHWSCHAFWYASLVLSISDIFLASNQLSHLSIIGPSNIISPRRTGNIPIHDTPAGTGVIRRHLLQMLTKIAQAAKSHGKLLPPAESVEEGGGKIPAEANADTLSKSSEAATEVESEQWKLNWRSIFVWHCPVMFTSYAAMFYMAGLFCLLTGPIFEALWSDTTEESQPGLFAALAYLITLWVSVTLFFYCALHAPD
ncbi:hypothetical protein B0T09DRAFT_241254, partial [Sordaria sp. MPI-SDFR-AT-0083]